MPLNQDLDWAIEDVRARLPHYTLFREYDEGNHRLLFATEKYRNAFGDLFREFADNLCDDVVDGITDRLQIIGWTSGDTVLNSLADTLWSRDRGEARSGAVHRNGFREGDGFTIVQTDAQNRARSFRQNPTQMAVRYSTESPDVMDLAAKVWKAGRRYRVNLYYPDRIERYASKGTGTDGGLPRAAAFTLLEAGDPALQEDQEAVEGADLGIPVFHYPNGELSQYGRSILAGVIPLQDALNKAVSDMLVTMESRALPQRTAAGIQVERDPLTGKERDPFKDTGPGSVWRTGNKDATFGEFTAADVAQFLEVADWFKIEAARKGALPPHAIHLRSGNAQAPSGIALLVAEGRTIKLAKDRQRDWGTEHRREMAYSLNLEMGRQDVTAEDVDLAWAPAETRDEKALVETLLIKKELGVPIRQVLLEAGYDSDEVDDFLEQADEQTAGKVAALSVLQGGREGVSLSDARTLSGSLGIPPGPVPPSGTQSTLAGS